MKNVFAKTASGSKWGAWIAAVLISWVLAFPLQNVLTRFPRGLLTDDAFFYVKIAWNLGIHHISSFDGIHITDGYHLVWAGLLAAISAGVGLFTASPWCHLGAMLLFYFILCWVIALRFGRGALQVLVLFCLGLYFKVLMETTLLALLLLLLYEGEYLRQGGLGRWKWRPVILVLLPLVRIDAVLIGGVLAASSLFPRGDESTIPALSPRRWGRVAADCIWLAAGAVLQLAIHHALFGTWTTVSMQLKGLEHLSLAVRVNRNLAGAGNIMSTGVFIVLWGMASWTAMRRPHSERPRHLVAIAAPGLFLLFHLAFNNFVSSWYYVPAAYVHVWYVFRFGPGVRRRAGMIVLMVLVALIPGVFAAKWTIGGKAREPQIEWTRTFAAEVARIVPPDEPIYQFDAAGWMGWYTGRRIVNGDGLVNDFAYARRLREGKLQGYLREQGIRYIILNYYPVGGTVIHYFGMHLTTDSVETVIAPPEGFPYLTAFGLYRLK
jgi:hypothetical protein